MRWHARMCACAAESCVMLCTRVMESRGLGLATRGWFAFALHGMTGDVTMVNGILNSVHWTVLCPRRDRGFVTVL